MSNFRNSFRKKKHETLIEDLVCPLINYSPLEGRCFTNNNPQAKNANNSSSHSKNLLGNKNNSLNNQTREALYDKQTQNDLQKPRDQSGEQCSVNETKNNFEGHSKISAQDRSSINKQLDNGRFSQENDEINQAVESHV